MRYRNPDAAIESLAQWVRDVQNSGLEITGLDPAKVAVRMPPGERLPVPEPKTPPPAPPSGVYTGHTCQECGSARMVRSGTCETCQDCGATSGCG